ncbi:MAG: 1-deoxy-D-xylulose-5-phosphate synthase [Coriobacteriia bacterium]|nr:1-deoxy-D-xylulose-5-phosphate synthase [Coriobacteriia bacterium]
MNRILDKIDSPQDLSQLDNSELQILADEIREEIITTTSKVGGHVSASLGTVETILAVHSLINSPYDKFIFDVGHQSYAHKLITGRNKSFKTLRQLGGISGFTKPSESEHDIHYSGHASDSLSIALGLAKAKKLNGTDEKIVTLIGDASIAGGMSFEALNQIGQEKLPMVIILNENNMSISPNVGGFTNHLKSMRVSYGYNEARRAAIQLKKYGKIGNFAYNAVHLAKESVKNAVMPDMLMFEKLGILCSQIVDGHDIGELKRTVSIALDLDKPVLVHVVTQKGAGYAPAADDPELFHGIGPYSIKTGRPKKSNTYTFTQAFSDAIVDEAKHNKDIVAMTAAMVGGTGLKDFAAKYQDRFIDCGIAEEHLLGMASGLAVAGKKPVVAIYSAFLQRAIDQVITNIALPNLDVIICVDRAGLVGVDGVSHHGLFDMANLKNIPNLTVIAPSNAQDLKESLHEAIEHGGPYVIRYPKGEAPKNKYKLDKKSHDVSILAFGDCVADAVAAQKKLKKKSLDVGVCDMKYVSPLDLKKIKSKVIVTVENGILQGGVGESILCELYSLGCKPKFKSLGIDNKFVSHGQIDELKELVGIDSKVIEEAVLSLL